MPRQDLVFATALAVAAIAVLFLVFWSLRRLAAFAVIAGMLYLPVMMGALVVALNAVW